MIVHNSFIICTKNRPKELLDCVSSIIGQHILPSELIVIDASHSEIQNHNLHKLQNALIGVGIRFIYCTVSRANLPYQRNLGIDLSSGQLVFFLDDDVILSPDFHAYILDMYQKYGSEGLGGVQGTSSDYVPPRWGELVSAMFMPEIGFRTRLLDRRPFALVNGTERERVAAEPKYVQWMRGYCMSFPRQVVEQFRFDENLDGYAAAEDIDFTYRVSKQYHLLEAPPGHLIHRQTRTDRLSIAAIVEMVTINYYYILCKTRPPHPFAALFNAWALVGFLVRGITSLIRYRTLGIFFGSLRGVGRILKGDLPDQRRRSLP